MSCYRITSGSIFNQEGEIVSGAGIMANEQNCSDSKTVNTFSLVQINICLRREAVLKCLRLF